MESILEKEEFKITLKTLYSNVTSKRKGRLQQLQDYFFQSKKREDNSSSEQGIIKPEKLEQNDAMEDLFTLLPAWNIIP